MTVSKSQKWHLSSDCSLQLDYMKLESLVIADQNAAAKTENRAFINRNLHIFLEQLRGTVKEIKQETKDLPESGHIPRHMVGFGLISE